MPRCAKIKALKGKGEKVSMIVKTLELEIYIARSMSLKDKRGILKSMIQKLRQKVNVSVAELDHLDDFRQASLGVAFVSNDQGYADKVLDKCLNFIETNYDIEIVNVIKELR